MKQIRVSVLIASHRRALLPRALASVFAQTLPMSQVQVLVNFSADPGLFFNNWNSLAAIASGDYFVILGDDDTLEPGYLEAALDTLDRTKADIAYSDVWVRNNDGELIELYRPPGEITLETMREGNKIWQSSVVRASRWRAVGGYDMRIPYAHDYDFWVRCLKDGATTAYLPICGWNYFVHDVGRVTDNTDKHLNWTLFDVKHPGFRLAP